MYRIPREEAISWPSAVFIIIDISNVEIDAIGCGIPYDFMLTLL